MGEDNNPNGDFESIETPQPMADLGAIENTETVETAQQSALIDSYDTNSNDNVDQPAEQQVESNSFSIPVRNNSQSDMSVPAETLISDIVKVPVESSAPVAETNTPVESVVAQPEVIEQPSVVVPVADSVAVATSAADVNQAPKKSAMKTVLLILAMILLSSGAATGAYYFRDKMANEDTASLKSAKTTVESKLDAEIAKNTELEAKLSKIASVTPSSAVLSNIKAAITSGNTAALEQYMAANVSAAGEGTASTITTSVKNAINGQKTWDFDLTSETLDLYRNGSFSQYFPDNAIVGRSAGKNVISFMFNGNGKISSVFISTNEDNIKK